MEIMTIDFDRSGDAIFIKDLGLIISSRQYINIDDVNDIDGILRTYFEIIIRGAWCDVDGEYDNLKKYINYKEIDTDDLIYGFGYFN